MDRFLSDVRQIWRSLIRQPLGSVLIVVVLSLGMAGVISILSFVKTMLWEPAPFPNAATVSNLGWRDPINNGDEVQGIAGRQLLEWRQRMPEGVELAGYSTATLNLADRDKVERYDGSFITANLLPMLGVQPLLGRPLAAADEVPGAPLALILSYELWQGRFNGDPNIIGKALRANARPAVVVAVMPQGFAFPWRQQVWAPAQIDAAADASRDVFLNLLVSRPPTLSLSAILTPVETWIADQRQQDPVAWATAEPALQNMTELFTDQQTRALMYIMLAVVVMVLLVACANAANLMLARTLSRSRDLALRLTLGASRARIALYLLGQSLGLCLISVLCALPLAHVANEAVMRTFRGTDDGPPIWMDFGLDGEMVLLAAGVALLSSLLVGLLPMLRLKADALAGAMRDGGRAVAGGVGSMSRVLVVSELAFACIVLLATLVMVRGIDGLLRADIGINPENLLTARIALFENAYPGDAAVLNFVERFNRELEQHPEVLRATAATTLPGDMAMTLRVRPEGRPPNPEGDPWTRLGSTDPGFLEAYGVELRRGRYFNAADRADTQKVAVIDEDFASAMFAGQDPIGRSVIMAGEDGSEQRYSVIGVIESMHLEDVGDLKLPTLLVPLSQRPARFLSFAVRTRGDPAAFKTEFTSLLRTLDPDTPAYWLRTYSEVKFATMTGEHVLLTMFSTFGLMALLMAAAGLYGLIAQIVGQRTREIGVQRALGAPALSVLRKLLTSTLVQVGIGIGIGIALGIPFASELGKVLDSLSVDTSSVLLLVLMLTVVAAVATLVPALRALRVDPCVALRHE